LTASARTSGSGGQEENGAPPVVAPPPGGHPRFPLFDSLRAIAALSVLVVHAAVISLAIENSYYGHFVRFLETGVTIFFLISGFLLYRPFVAGRMGQARTPRARDFARRRVLRIVPAYWLALIVFGIYPGIHVFTGDWWIYFGFLQNYPVYHLGTECQSIRGCGIGPAWSLGVEVTFYALLPIYAVLMGRLAAGRSMRNAIRLELIVLAALALGSVFVRLHALHDPRSLYLARTLLGTFYWFALGMTLAIASVVLHERESESWVARVTTHHPGVPWLIALAMYAGISLWLPASLAVVPTDLQFLTDYVGFGLVALLLLLPAVFGDGAGGVPRRILANPVLAWLGLISYGIFLWHQPVMQALLLHNVLNWVPGTPFATLAATAAAIAIPGAALSYYLVEKPFLRLKYKRLAELFPARPQWMRLGARAGKT
jgi:peptidoglycan/LPS O-acetylase OafA/YrhL